MQIKKLHIENFRSILSLDLSLENTTVFIGPNNAGKSAIIEAIRIGLSRRWGQKGTGFTEDDIHISTQDADLRSSNPPKIQFHFIEPSSGAWPADMVAELEEITGLTSDGLNKISFSITYIWDEDKENFETVWEFLNAEGIPFPPRRRSVNLTGFYEYILFFWLGALRDVDDEFIPRSRNWGGLLRGIKVPAALEKTIKETLDNLDAELLKADPRLSQIADTIGRATEVAVEETPGGARLRMLPMNIWDLLARAGVVLRNGEGRPWLPLSHHGQGLQSLSIIFLLQAAAIYQLADDLKEGTEPIFAIEEPEAHLHPQAARTLWARISELPGQKLVTTHSPYFVQNVPLHNLRIIRCTEGLTQVSFLPKKIDSDLPWTEKIDNFITGKRINSFVKNPLTGNITAVENFDDSIVADLGRCWHGDPQEETIKIAIDNFHRDCRVLITEEEEKELSFLGRRIRGEIFFARCWVLVEGPTEYLLLKALSVCFDYDLDQHGISIIDFKNNGNVWIYPALADAFGIPWQMITDGDSEGSKFKKQLLKRGFSEADLKDHFKTLPSPNDIEDQLIADGHETLLREILKDAGVTSAPTCPFDEFKLLLKNRKTVYMNSLAQKIITDRILGQKMPKPFVDLIKNLAGIE